MAFKPNYNQQRGDRARTKDQKKSEKLRRRQEQSDQRKGITDEVPTTDGDEAAGPTSDAGPTDSAN